MAGYGNPIVHISFPELSSGPDDPIWVSMRNARLMSPKELQPKPVATDENGRPVDNDQAQEAMYEVLAKLIVGWRVYDPNSIKINEETGELGDMERLPSPATPQLVARLPVTIIKKLAEEMTEAMNPPSDSAAITTKTSLSLPSQSTKEHGRVA